MSFRIENKYLINNQNHEDFYKFLSNCSAEVLYPRRKISSIYFDNLELQSYRDSVEGLVPRKKIRIRCYPNINETYQKDNLEIKINSVEGRYKEIKKNINTEYYFNHGYFDAQYGLCLPIIKIQYIREYYKIFDFRATLDKLINYHKLDSKNFTIPSETIIFEIKSSNLYKLNQIEEQIPFQKTRYSKYCNGIEKFNLI